MNFIRSWFMTIFCYLIFAHDILNETIEQFNQLTGGTIIELAAVYNKMGRSMTGR